jgi:methylated-DNA-[protein]-cysteine S-methyltransferase
MAPPSFALFDTAIGRCGVAWGDGGLVGLQLPEASDRATRDRLRARFPEAVEAPPPAAIARAQAEIAALLRGEAADLSSLPLDMAGVPAFHRRVYEVARTIPPGATISYGELAARLGSPGAARAVGQALGRNPFAIVVPCHRVFAAGGKVGGFSANGGIRTKLRLLELETARAEGTDGAGAALPFDPTEAVRHLRAGDPALARVIDAVGPLGLRRKPTGTLFGALAEAIVYQQLTGKAAATIFARLRALFDAREAPTPEQILRASDERLRGAGLSRGKLLALRDLARKVADEELPPLAALAGMDDEAIVECLTSVRGIGRWTVEMLLIFRLGRPDVLPLDDLGIRKGFAATLGKGALPTAQALEARGARWRPYRSVASWYLWRAAEGSAAPRAKVEAAPAIARATGEPRAASAPARRAAPRGPAPAPTSPRPASRRGGARTSG